MGREELDSVKDSLFDGGLTWANVHYAIINMGDNAKSLNTCGKVTLIAQCAGNL